MNKDKKRLHGKVLQDKVKAVASKDPEAVSTFRKSPTTDSRREFWGNVWHPQYTTKRHGLPGTGTEKHKEKMG